MSTVMKSKRSITHIMAVSLILIISAPITILGQHSSNWQIANSGGAVTSTSNFTIHSSIGEPIIDNKGSGHYTGSGYLSPGSPTPVEDQETTILPTSFELFQNYPNPFNPSTTIEFALPERCYVNLDIYNILGQKVITLISGEVGAGFWRITWDGIDSKCLYVATGVYLYRLKAGDYSYCKKMLIVK